MDENTARGLLERLAETKPPPSRVDIDLARRVGRKRLRWRLAGLLGISVVAAAAAVTVIAGGIVSFGPGSRMTGSSPASGGPARHTVGLPNPIGWNGNLYPLGPPGMGAVKTTVAGARAAVGFPVPVPSTAAASRANLTQVWVNGNAIPRKDRQVALVFDKGKVDILMHRATDQRALRYFHAFIAEKNQNGGATAEIGQVNGRPALVIWPGTSYSHSNPAVVIFWRNGIFISIYGNTKAYGTHILLAVAESMH